MKKRAIVTFAKGAHYEYNAQYLVQSLNGNYAGDVYLFKDESKIPSPPHSELPYAFKPYAFKTLFAKGYETVLWLDSVITAVEDLNPLFEYIETKGSYFYVDGWNCAQWTNDSMLKYFNISRDEAENIPQIYACIIGLCISNNTTKEFHKNWLESIPYFKGSWHNHNYSESTDSRCRGHRHDQSAASIIAHKLNILKTREETNKYVQVVCGCNEITKDTCLRTK